jgi:hypothetical protein
MEFLDESTLTERDRFLMMCIQRIEGLEAEVCRLKLRQKDAIIRDIACCTAKSSCIIDVVSYFLKIPPDIRATHETKSMIFNVIPMYKHNWTERLTYLSKICPSLSEILNMDESRFDDWGFMKDTNFGVNLYTVLEALTEEELEDYWNTYRIIWTKWKGPPSS